MLSDGVVTGGGLGRRHTTHPHTHTHTACALTCASSWRSSCLHRKSDCQCSKSVECLHDRTRCSFHFLIIYLLFYFAILFSVPNPANSFFGFRLCSHAPCETRLLASSQAWEGVTPPPFSIDPRWAGPCVCSCLFSLYIDSLFLSFVCSPHIHPSLHHALSLPTSPSRTTRHHSQKQQKIFQQKHRHSTMTTKRKTKSEAKKKKTKQKDNINILARDLEHVRAVCSRLCAAEAALCAHQTANLGDAASIVLYI